MCSKADLRLYVEMQVVSLAVGIWVWDVLQVRSVTSLVEALTFGATWMAPLRDACRGERVAV